MATKSKKRAATAKKAAAPKAKDQTIRTAAEALLKKPIPYQEIVDKVRSMFPGSQTSVKSVQWYASRMRASKIKVPARPRKAAERVAAAG